MPLLFAATSNAATRVASTMCALAVPQYSLHHCSLSTASLALLPRCRLSRYRRVRALSPHTLACDPVGAAAVLSLSSHTFIFVFISYLHLDLGMISANVLHTCLMCYTHVFYFFVIHNTCVLHTFDYTPLGHVLYTV
jgi:hypothetical protein